MRRAIRREAPTAPRSPHPQRWWWALACITLLALALRAVFLMQIRGTLPLQVVIGDAHQYDVWAQTIAAGQWIGSGVFYQTPLYPYLLAIIFAVAGHHLFLIRIVQSVLGALSIALLGIAGRRFVSPGAGLAAAALLAVYPPAIFFDGLIQKAALDAFLVAAALALLGEFSVRRRWPWIASAGVAIGLLMLNRENARVLVPVIGAWLLWLPGGSWRRQAAWVGAFVFGVALVTLPVAVRNKIAGGEFLISTSQMGPNFYIGNHYGASGTYDPLVAGRADAIFEREDAARLASAAEGRPLTPGEVSDYWMRRALSDIVHAPASWTRLVGRKLLMTVNATEAADTESLQLYADYSPLLAGLSWLTLGAMLPLAAIGIWATRKQWRQLAILYAIAGALIVSVALFFVFARYRYPIVPVLVLFAGAGVASLPGLWRDRRRAAPAVALALAAAAIANLPLRVAYDTSYYNVAVALDRAGRPADALPLLRKSLIVSPDDGRQDALLGRVLRATGDVEGATAAFADGVRLEPFDVAARTDYGKALLETGRGRDAVLQLRSAETLAPEVPQVHADLAVALADIDRWGDAIAEDRESLRLNPDDPDAHNHLGRALAHESQLGEAVREFARALTLRPNDAETENNLAVALRDEHDAAAAAEHFRRALALAPGKFEIHANYGDCLAMSGHLTEATAEYVRAVELAPSSVEMRYRLAALYARSGALGPARASLEAARTVAQAQQDSAGVSRIDEALKQLGGG